MCLFRQDQQENSCNHQECKNYYQLNMQMCLYYLQQGIQANLMNQDKSCTQIPLSKFQDTQLLEFIKKKLKTEASDEQCNSNNSIISGISGISGGNGLVSVPTTGSGGGNGLSSSLGNDSCSSNLVSLLKTKYLHVLDDNDHHNNNEKTSETQGAIEMIKMNQEHMVPTTTATIATPMSTITTTSGGVSNTNNTIIGSNIGFQSCKYAMENKRDALIQNNLMKLSSNNMMNVKSDNESIVSMANVQSANQNSLKQNQTIQNIPLTSPNSMFKFNLNNTANMAQALRINKSLVEMISNNPNDAIMTAIGIRNNTQGLPTILQSNIEGNSNIVFSAINELKQNDSCPQVHQLQQAQQQGYQQHQQQQLNQQGNHQQGNHQQGNHQQGNHQQGSHQQGNQQQQQQQQQKQQLSSCEDNLNREFQNRILNLLIGQNKMLIELKEKNELLQDALGCLVSEINTLRNHMKNNANDKALATSSVNPLYYHQIIGNSTDTVTIENLLTYLYGNNQDFSYQLVLKNELALPLYRERNFKFTVILKDKNGNHIENSNRIPLAMSIYSSENPPKYIDTNTAGNKILKGFIEKDLIKGEVIFDKIQVKEVTSHFRNGWVFFVIYPKPSALTMTSYTNHHGNLTINPVKIKPLIIEKVVVKAKKTKEKDNNESSDMYCEEENHNYSSKNDVDIDDNNDDMIHHQHHNQAQESIAISSSINAKPQKNQSYTCLQHT